MPPRSRKSAGKIGGGLAGLTVFRDASTVSGYGAPAIANLSSSHESPQSFFGAVTETVTASVQVMSTRSPTFTFARAALSATRDE